MEKVGKSVFTIPLLLRIETKLEMCIDKDTSVSSNKNSKMFDSLCVCVCVLKNYTFFSLRTENYSFITPLCFSRENRVSLHNTRELRY